MGFNEFIIKTIIDSGNKQWCEDGIVCTNFCVGVLDGATPIDIIRTNEYPTQTCWFVNNFISELDKISANSDVESMCLDICSKLAGSYNYNVEEYNRPICTCLLLSIENNSLVVNCLSDCHFYCKFHNGEIMHITDERITNFSNKTISVVNRIYNNDKEKKDAIKLQKIENRKLLNNNGYYALSLDNKWVGNFIIKKIPLKSISEVLICTDGFNRLFLEYNIIGIDDYFNKKISLEECRNLIRNYEHSTNLNSCVKKADDIAAVYIKL